MNGVEASVRYECVDWYSSKNLSDLKDVDLVIAADVVWIPELVEPFVDTIQAIFDQGGDVSCKDTEKKIDMLLANQLRSQKVENRFFSLLCSKGFEVKTIEASKYHPEFQCKNISIYHIRKKD